MSSSPTSEPRPLRRHLLPLLVMALAALWSVSPALPHFGTHPMGDASLHSIDAAWLYSLVAESFGRFPPALESSLFDHPRGWPITVKFVDIGNAVLAIPLTRTLGGQLSHDITLTLMVFLAGCATYALALGQLQHRGGAMAAGVLFALSDPLMFTLKWGEDDVSTQWMLPAYMAVLCWSLRRLARAPAPGAGRWRDPALLAGGGAGAALGFVGWFNTYYLLFNSLFTGLAGLAFCWKRHRLPWRRYGMYALAFVLLAAAFWAPRTQLGQAPWEARVGTAKRLEGVGDFLHAPKGLRKGTTLDASGLLNPVSPLRRQAVLEDEQNREGVVYLGLLALALAGRGGARGRVRDRRLLLVMALLALTLAFGSHLRAEGELVEIAGRNVPGPWGATVALLPFLDRIKHPYRFVTIFFVMVAVFGGGGAAWLSAQLKGLWRHLALSLMVLLCIAERTWASPGLAPIRATPVLLPEALLDIPAPAGRPALLHLPLEVPFTSDDMESSRYARYAQMRGHGRPLFMRSYGPWLEGQVSQEEARCAAVTTSNEGVGTVVITTNFAEVTSAVNSAKEPWSQKKIQRLAQQALSAHHNLALVLEPTHEEEGLVIYQLPRVGDPGFGTLAGCEHRPDPGPHR